MLGDHVHLFLKSIIIKFFCLFVISDNVAHDSNTETATTAKEDVDEPAVNTSKEVASQKGVSLRVDFQLPCFQHDNHQYKLRFLFGQKSSNANAIERGFARF